MSAGSSAARAVAGSGDRNDAESVVGSMTFLADTKVKPVTYNPPPGTAPVSRVGNYGTFPTRIHNGRLIAAELSLDRQGFVLLPHRTAVGNFLDQRAIKGVYYPEMERLVQSVTGASKVVVFDHTVRVGDDPVGRGLRAPVRLVHNDYTEKSGPQRVRDLLGEEAEARLQRRYVEINVWRPIRGPVLSAPLALADAQSIAPGDLVTCDLVYADRTGEIFHGLHNPNQRWYYFPRMTTEEVVLIKCFDSLKDGRARFSLHSAFDDPTTPAGAPPRESIEIRTFAFFDS
jgi:hypothetical protein